MTDARDTVAQARKHEFTWLVTWSKRSFVATLCNMLTTNLPRGSVRPAQCRCVHQVILKIPVGLN